jgi:hypothetical protein
VRVDDYKNACRIAAEELAGQDPRAVAAAAGADWRPEAGSGAGGFELAFFGRPVRVTAPAMEAAWREPRAGEDFSLTDAVLVLHYLTGAKGLPPTGEWAAYRQIPGGEFYAKAFHSRAEVPLAKAFGQTPGLLTRATAALGGEAVPGFGDEAGRFRVLPNIDLLAAVHLADEEFESAGLVLFDRVVGACLTSEDISWLGSALVYRLMGAAKNLV